MLLLLVQHSSSLLSTLVPATLKMHETTPKTRTAPLIRTPCTVPATSTCTIIHVLHFAGRLTVTINGRFQIDQ